MDWQTTEKLPEINETVMVCFKSDFDGEPVYAWGARLEGDEGWCWGIACGPGGIRLDEDAGWNNVEADDEYEVTHWMPLPKPPALFGKDAG